MKKIYADKKAKAADVIREISLTDDDIIVVCIPNDSAMSGDSKELKKIKTRADDLGISVMVESTDEGVLESASTVGLEIIGESPVRERTPVIDIIDLRKAKNKRSVILKEVESEEGNNEEEPEEEPIRKGLISPKNAKVSIYTKEAESEDDKEELEKDIEIKHFVDYYHPSGALQDTPEDMEKEDETEKRDRFGLRRLAIFLLLLFFMGAGAFYVVKVLPKAEIKMIMQRTEWNFEDDITGLVAANGISAENSTIPVQIFKLSKNEVRSFPATESKQVNESAKGVLTIYNAYSSARQSLVKNTRFVTPGGKIYRLTASVDIPGAVITDGKIIPSSIETEVSADATGESFNSGPVAKLSIPGFQGSPKYDGFYGDLKQGAKGGFSGVMKVATTDDIAKAKEALENSLKDNIRAELEKNLPSGFKILEDTYSASVIKSEQVDSSDSAAKGQFSYVTVIEARISAFKEQDILDVMKGKFAKDHPEEYIIKESTIDYGKPVMELSSGKVTIPLKFNSSWERSFDMDTFKTSILGKNADDLKVAALSIPGINTAKIELWPFFVRSVPADPTKVNITVD